ncbi:MAG: hypothetical protein JWN86_985 [Planctomycetota bacterium]|nr:hypothetical protein [Planctomycetota bacterium]
MAGPMNPLPTSADDPRLRGWYHTIELAPGITTSDAVYDLRPIASRSGLPESLVGKTVLDVGTADGFWAFEMERRGADRVVAFDIARMGESNVLPRYRATLPDWWATSENYCAERFWTAHAMRQSRVEYRTGSVYDLSPETIGTFDLVYCGSLLVHLFNPLEALIAIRSVTRAMAVIEACSTDPAYNPVDEAFPDQPLMKFGSLDGDGGEPGRQCMYWYFTEKALYDMLVYAGFGAVEPRGQYRITGPGGGNCPVVSAVAHVGQGACPSAEGPVSTTGYVRLKAELEDARAEIAALKTRLHPFEGLGARSVGTARRLQRISGRFPRIASAVRKVAGRKSAGD